MLAAHVGSKIDAERGRAMGLLDCHAVTKRPTRRLVHMMPSPSPPRLPRPALPLVKYPATRATSAQATRPALFFSSHCFNVVRIIWCVHSTVYEKLHRCRPKHAARPGLPVHSGVAPVTAACPGIGPANPGCQANRVVTPPRTDRRSFHTIHRHTQRASIA